MLFSYDQKSIVSAHARTRLRRASFPREMADGERDSEAEDAAAAADTLAERQRLKAALHYSVGKVCGEVEGSEFSREVVAAVTEAAFNQTQLLAWDVEAFAKSVLSSSSPVEID